RGRGEPRSEREHGALALLRWHQDLRLRLRGAGRSRLLRLAALARSPSTPFVIPSSRERTHRTTARCEESHAPDPGSMRSLTTVGGPGGQLTAVRDDRAVGCLRTYAGLETPGKPHALELSQ